MDSDSFGIAIATVLAAVLGALATWWIGRPKPPITFLAQVEQIDRVLAALQEGEDWSELRNYRSQLLASAEAWVHPRTLRWRQATLGLPIAIGAIGIAVAFLIGGLVQSVAAGVLIVFLTFALTVVVWMFVAAWSSWVSVSVSDEVQKKLKRSPLQLR